jgi:hypothetical protein
MRNGKHVKTVNNKNVYIGLRGGLYTKNSVPVYEKMGFYSTNPNFNVNAHMNSLRNREH